VDEFRRLHSLPGGGVYHPYEEGVEAWAQLLARVGEALFEIATDHDHGRSQRDD
jgi:hypothetical protein